MESRTGHAVVGSAAMSPPSLRSSKSADRVTPAQPTRAACRTNVPSETRLHTDIAEQLRPTGRSMPAQPSPPDMATR